MKETIIQLITSEQINTILELLAARLRKSELPSEAVQHLLENQGETVADEMFRVFRRHVREFTDMLVRSVTIREQERSKDPLLVLVDLEKQRRVEIFITEDSMRYMPRGEGARAKVYLFRVDDKISSKELQEAYASRGLEPVDPITLIALNQSDESFSEDFPNATYWMRPDGGLCYICFYPREVYPLNPKPRVDIGYWALPWKIDYRKLTWWFAGVARK